MPRHLLEGEALKALNNLDATTAPVATNDVTEGYSVGSIWIDVSEGHIYQCVDASEDLAVWQQLDSAITDDAPSDGSVYGRLNGTWAMIGTILGTLLLQPTIEDDTQLSPAMATTEISWV